VSDSNKNFQSQSKRSTLESIAIICKQLGGGIHTDEIRKLMDPNSEYAADFLDFYIEFALENNWIKKEDSGKYRITDYGKEFINAFLT
jgi:hypothetical protein